MSVKKGFLMNASEIDFCVRSEGICVRTEEKLDIM